jgi:RND superfamily putative drug exporter
VLVAGGVVAGRLFDHLDTTEALPATAESMRAERRLDQVAPVGPEIFTVIRGPQPYDPALVASVTAVSRQVRMLPGVRKVENLYDEHGGAIGEGNRTTLVTVELVTGLTDAQREPIEDRVTAVLRGIAPPAASTGGGRPEVLIGGDKLAERAFAEQSVRDLAIGESVAFALLIVVLLIIFGGLVGALLPLVVAVATIAGTLLTLLALTAVADVSEYAVNVVSLLGLALAIDYALVIVSRYREERADADRSPRDSGAATQGEAGRALRVCVATAGRAVLVSGLAVGAALAGLAAFAEPLLASMALGGAVVVALSTLAALTLLPALLAVVGHRLPPGRTGARRGAPNLLARLAGFALRRPAAVLVWSVLGLVGLALPALGADLRNSDARSLPVTNPARQAYDAMQRDFARGDTAPVTVVADVAASSPEALAYLNRLNRMPGMKRLTLRKDVAAGAMVVDLVPAGTTGAAPARRLVTAVRDLGPPFPVLVGGESAKVVDARHSLAARLPLAASILVLATFGLLLWLTGAVLIPLKALLLNVLTLSATLGVLVVLFQWGWGGPLLFFQPWGALDVTTPVLLFVFVFGLSMDYEVFLIARIKEEYDRTGDNDRAVLGGITATGAVVTAAAVCVGIVFLGFAFGGLVAVKEIGVGMAVAILLDVTVVRGLLLPAAMSLLGDRNWWRPGGRRRPGNAPEPAGATTALSR